MGVKMIQLHNIKNGYRVFSSILRREAPKITDDLISTCIYFTQPRYQILNVSNVAVALVNYFDFTEYEVTTYFKVNRKQIPYNNYKSQNNELKALFENDNYYFEVVSSGVFGEEGFDYTTKYTYFEAVPKERFHYDMNLLKPVLIKKLKQYLRSAQNRLYTAQRIGNDYMKLLGNMREVEKLLEYVKSVKTY